MSIPPPERDVPVAAPRPFSTLDLVLTPVLSVVLLLSCAAAFVVSMFAAMGTDSCSSDRGSVALIGLAYAVAWGGIVAAVLVAGVGVLVSALARRTMFGWPITGLVVLLVATLLGGVLLVTAVGR
jgi:hypothetical protein